MISTPIIYLHSIKLDAPAAELDASWRVLDRDEKARADRFRFAQLKSRWTLARAGLKSVLSLYCSVPPDQLRFDHGKHGKPYLVQPMGLPDLHFSLSHAHDLALVTVTRLGPIGVDHEYQRPFPNWQAVAEQNFSPREYLELMRLPETQCLEAFYRCWTRKEAVIKASGEGFSKLRVDYLPGQSVSRWQLEHLDLADGYIGALAVQSAADVVVERPSSP